MQSFGVGSRLPMLDDDGELDYAGVFHEVESSGSDFIDADPAHVVDAGEWTNVKAAAAETRGLRAEMEDAVCLVGDGADSWLFGVFDGHGGSGCSAYVSSAFKAKFKAGCRAATDDVVVDLCMDVDKQFLEERGGERTPVLDESGSTATFAFLTRSAAKPNVLSLKVGNVGDSRVIMYDSAGKRTVPMTVDHKPSNEIERTRIRAAGGWVAADRVNGRLGVARAFGDTYFKTTDDAHTHAVVAVPDVTNAYLRPGDVVVLCCDGIVEEMDNDEAMRVVLAHLREKPDDVSGAAQALCNAAVAKGSTDNCTALVVAITKMASSRRRHAPAGAGARPQGVPTRVPSAMKVARTASHSSAGSKMARSASAHRASPVRSSPPKASPPRALPNLHLIRMSLEPKEQDFGFVLEPAPGAERGCRVVSVVRDSAAWRACLRAGMTVASVDGKNATTPVVVERRVRVVAARGGDREVELMVRTNGPVSWAKVRREQSTAAASVRAASPVQRAFARSASAGARRHSTTHLPPSNSASVAYRRSTTQRSSASLSASVKSAAPRQSLSRSLSVSSASRRSVSNQRQRAPPPSRAFSRSSTHATPPRSASRSAASAASPNASRGKSSNAMTRSASHTNGRASTRSATRSPRMLAATAPAVSTPASRAAPAPTIVSGKKGSARRPAASVRLRA